MRRVWSAARRARAGIATMAVVYAASILTGAVMVHAGYAPALRHRDQIVATAHRNDPSARADDRGEHFRAAVIDFSRNLFLAAVPDTVGGLTIVMPIGFGAYRGWVGGLVSVDGRHRSRLRNVRSGAYYLITLLLQVAGFVVAAGSGLSVGYAFFRHDGPFAGPSWFRLPVNAVRDVGWLYLIVVPAFAAGSLFEFLAQ